MSEVIINISNLAISLVSNFGLLGIFILMTLESASIPFPSFITMPLAGFLATKGYWHIGVAVVIGILGNSFGGILAYWFGYKKGESWIRIFIKNFGKYILLNEQKFNIGTDLFKKYDKKIAFISRIIPVVRAFNSLPAGVAKVSFWAFVTYSLLGNIIYVTFSTYLGFILGENWRIIGPIFKKIQFLVLGFILLTVIYFSYRRFRK